LSAGVLFFEKYWVVPQQKVTHPRYRSCKRIYGNELRNLVCLASFIKLTLEYYKKLIFNLMKKILYFLKISVLALLLFFNAHAITAQTVASVREFGGKEQAKPSQQAKLKEVLLDVKMHYQVNLLFEEQILEGLNVNPNLFDKSENVEENLTNLLSQFNLRFKKVKKSTYLIISPKKSKKEKRASTRELLESNKTIFLTSTTPMIEPVLIIENKNVEEKKSTRRRTFAKVSGRITDAISGEPIPGVSVSVAETQQGTITDAQGAYNLQINAGTYKLRFSFIGYETKIQEVTVGNDAMTVDVTLEESVTSLADVVVIGSRSTAVRTNIDTPVPVDVISVKELQSTGQIEPTQMINMVAPSFNSARQTVADGTDHIDPATIRGLGPDQVLTLVNGKRRHNQALINVNGTVGRGSVGTDLNTLPTAAIERIEVLRDGAASQYGSDAISGVINVVMKKEAGTSANLHWGRQYAGDGRALNFGLYHGMKVGKKGVISVALDMRLRGATNRAGDYTGPVYTRWDNVADLALRQQRFNQDQAQIAQNNFSLAKNMLVGNSAVNNYGGMLNGNIPLGKKTTFYFTGILNYREGKAAGFYRYPFQTTQVISELYPNGFLPEIASTILDRSWLMGVSGEFGNGWRWDLSNVYGGNSFRFDVNNSNNASQFAQGRNAQTSFYAGQLGFNQNTSDFSVSKDFGKQIGLQSFNVAGGLNFRIDNYSIKAGEEASWQNYAPTAGRVGGAQVFPGFQPANAVNQNRNVLGAYIDLESDLTKKLLVNLAGRFENYSDFGSNFAGKLSARYKFAEAFSIRAAISNGFRAPSIHQRYFSAISTVFVSVAGQLEPRQQGTFRNDGAVAAAFGIPSLKAESSTNLSVGITSQIAKNVSLTIDLYQIDIKDRIILTSSFVRGTAGTGLQIANILDGAGQRDVNSAIFFTNAVNTRTQGVDIVFSATPQIGNGSLGITLAGNLNKTEVQGTPQVSATLPPDQFGNQIFNRQEKGRLEFSQPRSKFTLGFSYKVNKFGANLRITRFGEVQTLDPADPRLDEIFSPKMISDLSVSYKVAKFLQVVIGANNILDTYPDKLQKIQALTATNTIPLDNSSFGRFVYSRNATQFGFNGGYYYVSLNANF
jgi:iron complex outermembrane receptor protein